MSTYVATIAQNQRSLDVTDKTFGATKKKLESEKMQINATNLPGFSEYKIDEDLTKKIS